MRAIDRRARRAQLAVPAAVLTVLVSSSAAIAEEVVLAPSKDNTIYDNGNSNGAGSSTSGSMP